MKVTVENLSPAGIAALVAEAAGTRSIVWAQLREKERKEVALP